MKLPAARLSANRTAARVLVEWDEISGRMRYTPPRDINNAVFKKREQTEKRDVLRHDRHLSLFNASGYWQNAEFGIESS